MPGSVEKSLASLEVPEDPGCPSKIRRGGWGGANIEWYGTWSHAHSLPPSFTRATYLTENHSRKAKKTNVPPLANGEWAIIENIACSRKIVA